jgi:hypothetical protein
MQSGSWPESSGIVRGFFSRCGDFAGKGTRIISGSPAGSVVAAFRIIFPPHPVALIVEDPKKAVFSISDL